MIDKYRQSSNVKRASLMSVTLTGIRLCALRVNSENFTAVQTVTSALVMSLTRPQARAVRPQSADREVCDRRLLWRFGISGDRPVILVLVSSTQGLGMMRVVSQALSLWLWGNIACDGVPGRANAGARWTQHAFHPDPPGQRGRAGGHGPMAS